MTSEERISRAKDIVLDYLTSILRYEETSDYVEMTGFSNGDVVTYRVYDDGSIIHVITYKHKEWRHYYE